jgi:hypothetical protein
VGINSQSSHIVGVRCDSYYFWVATWVVIEIFLVIHRLQSEILLDLYRWIYSWFVLLLSCNRGKCHVILDWLVIHTSHYEFQHGLQLAFDDVTRVRILLILGRSRISRSMLFYNVSFYPYKDAWQIYWTKMWTSLG